MEQEVKTENEQKKEYLRSYKDHVRRVNRISEEIKELREMMMSTKAINYDGMPHGSGGQGDLSGEVARIQGLIDELKRERGLRIMTYQDIARRIKKLKSRNEDDVLFYAWPDGSIKKTPYYTGLDEITQVYENTSTDTDQLEDQSIDKLTELMSKKKFGMDVEKLGIDVGIGDIIGGRDYLTGMYGAKPVENITCSITAGVISKEYELEGENDDGNS